VLTIVNIKQAPAATAVFAVFLMASIFSALFFGSTASKVARKIITGFGRTAEAKQDALTILVIGLSAGMSFFLQAAKRSAFAPSGSDVAFLLSFAPLFAIILAGLTKSERTWFKAAGSAAALLGTIAIVGNWERPSSFSPFSLFAFDESLVLLSALAMAVCALLSKRLLERYSVTALATLALWIATCMAAVISAAFDGPAAILKITADGWLILAIASVFSIILGIFSLFDLLSTQSISRSISALHLLPILVTALIGIEKVFGFAYMATPFEWAPIIVGSIVTLAGTALLWSQRTHQQHYNVNKTVVSLLVVLAIASALWSGIALFYPYKVSFISGVLDAGQPYEAQFLSLRYNSVGGFMLLLATIINLAASVGLIRQRMGPYRALLWALFSSLLLSAIVVVGNTPIITWFADIPSDIQHGIGTPYVTLIETSQPNIPWLIALSLTCAYIALLAGYFMSSSRKARLIGINSPSSATEA
jgi:drug/metabolite transporter (DMT)-like permease